MILRMVDIDSAFMWEAEALRTSSRVGRHSRRDHRVKADDAKWVTLRQANRLTGIPVETIRKWARRKHIDSYMDSSEAGERRMVAVADVRSRAEQLGRDDRAQSTELPDEARASEPETEPGTMLVPIDAWDKMLLQLGNLQQAGQQLAEARERAAKAETESKFLKERLSEMRAELSALKDVQTEPVAEETPAAEPSEGQADDTKTLRAHSFEIARHFFSTWRERPKR